MRKKQNDAARKIRAAYRNLNTVAAYQDAGAAKLGALTTFKVKIVKVSDPLDIPAKEQI